MLPFVRQAVHRFGFKKFDINQDAFRIPINENGFSATLLIHAITGEYTEQSSRMNISSLDGVLLIRKVPHGTFSIPAN
jgi:hypothetical protein